MTKNTNSTEKLRGRVFVACWFVVISLMAYGIFRSPYAPIRFRDGGYYDKTGGVFPAEAFPAYQIWQRALYLSFAGTAVTNLGVWLFTRTRKASRQEGKLGVKTDAA